MNRLVVKMKLMVALIFSLVVEKLKSGLPNKSVLTTEFSFSVIILALGCMPKSTTKLGWLVKIKSIQDL